ncbi:hypothetical protein BHE90_000554 [Fusarium euwallaceae]|uniref:Clr5 domain-containing protein n=1 Tax=Fusarium euwallaceae TaxID=1147111 RepID=A0A430M9X4_9HYPO|nr:hypothetical protein BHE90_000554 [Fusarium euwallaceae]
MSAMEKYGLPKSERIWKARFKSWGMFKNLRENDVRRVARELNARPGRDSEVFLNGKKISMERVQRSLAKRGESGPEAKAASITVQTPPATCVASPGSMGITAKTTACAFFPGGEVKGPFDVQSFRADGRGLSIQELLVLKAKGAKQISDRQLDEAILSLRTALTGLQHVHKSTHSSVVDTAWCLVDAYTLDQKVQSGDDIINWISSAYSQDLSLWHPQTLTHYLRVVEKLQARGRGDDAKSLGFRLFAAIRDDMPSTKVIQVRQCSDHDSQFDSVADDAEFQRIFDERSDIGEIDQQLRLASIWSVSTLPGMQSAMEQLILRLASLPLDFRDREVDARCIYIRVLVYEKGQEAARSECKRARDSLADLIHANRPPFATLIRLSQELAHVHKQAGDSSGFQTVQKWTANKLENYVLRLFSGPDCSSNASALIDHFVEVGLSYQNHSKQGEAHRWFERAHGLSVKIFGCDDSTSQRLEKAVRERWYCGDGNLPSSRH